MDLLIQTAGSTVAILALTGIAWWLALGRAPRLHDAETVRRAAEEVEDGFDPFAWSCDHEGAAALARDAAGRIMVIRRHGNRFVGRILGPAAKAGLEVHLRQSCLVVDSGERRFGKVFLAIPDAQAWADAINQLQARQDA